MDDCKDQNQNTENINYSPKSCQTWIFKYRHSEHIPYIPYYMLTMKLSFFSFVVLRLVSAKTSCGPEGTLTIAGSASVKILAEKWKERYQDSCPNSSILIHDGGSSAGAARVCGTRAQTTPVDIGGMTRDWNKVEAVAENGWLYDCERSQRKAIQVSSTRCDSFWRS